jgi:beta-galactosidase/beta-glucuronidase
VLAVLENTGETPVKAAFTGMIQTNMLSFKSDETELAPSEAKEVCVGGLVLNNPKLWWPNTYGEQPLYDINLTATENGQFSDELDFKFGVREFTYTNEWPLKIYCNGVRIICRGGNWGMDDSNLACTPADYDIKLRFHRDMNFTMIRNWVGMTNHPAFYEACDRYGILVWDDF